MNVELTPEEKKQAEDGMEAMGFEKAPSSDAPQPFERCPVCHWRLSVDCCTAGRALIAHRKKASGA